MTIYNKNVESIVNASLYAYKKIIQKNPEKLKKFISNYFSKKLDKNISEDDIESIEYIEDEFYKIKFKNSENIHNLKL
jgi:hypothetical protein